VTRRLSTVRVLSCVDMDHGVPIVLYNDRVEGIRCVSWIGNSLSTESGRNEVFNVRGREAIGGDIKVSCICSEVD